MPESQFPDAVAAFSRHRLVVALEGHPGTAVHVASRLTPFSSSSSSSSAASPPPSPSSSPLTSPGDGDGDGVPCLELVLRETELCEAAANVLAEYRAREATLCRAIIAGASAGAAVTTSAALGGDGGGGAQPAGSGALSGGSRLRVDGGKQQQAQSVASAASPTTTSRVNVGVGNSRLGSADVDLALRDFPWWHGDLATREASKARLNAEKGRAAQRHPAAECGPR